jgi:hypothetical protein
MSRGLRGGVEEFEDYQMFKGCLFDYGSFELLQKTSRGPITEENLEPSSVEEDVI